MNLDVEVTVALVSLGQATTQTSVAGLLPDRNVVRGGAAAGSKVVDDGPDVRLGVEPGSADSRGRGDARRRDAEQHHPLREAVDGRVGEDPPPGWHPTRTTTG